MFEGAQHLLFIGRKNQFGTKTTSVEQDVQFPFLLAHEFIQRLVDKMGDRINVFKVTNTTGQHMAAAVEEWCAHFVRTKHGGAYWALW